MFFASDNGAPAHPAVMEAIMRANDGYTSGYGAEDAMESVRQSIRDLFEAPDAAVFLVSTGTAANALALAAMTKPYETTFCHTRSHVHEDECGAPEFYSNGAKLTLVDGPLGKMTPESLTQSIYSTGRLGVHNIQRGSMSITNLTEIGTAYTVEETRALCDIAHAKGVKTHLDGARFANAMIALNCTPAEMTWKAGIDAVSFGGTKNGCMGVEAVIFFDPELAWEFELRRKRGGHLLSKHRILSAQMQGYLADDLWIDLARQANAAGARMAAGLAQSAEAELLAPADGNMVFANWTRATHDKLATQGLKYYFTPYDPAPTGPADEQLAARLVCSWSTTDAEIDQFLSHFS